ncbi:uncharacterized protein I206_105570 [Kwoniella pini CBS 10737]|uniref:Uncharacterized protein n=1 Tax=Kwoniella pini CBS 10737 TaxID=1296096 RepID=A0A1B9I3V2_9TREE|nr:uncharacterized protein I206_03527 [Kwoniella pini CBS 10737]OCF50208.1 hypothetical protein I206_03527 [Kwoniella pini CBS 10737]
MADSPTSTAHDPVQNSAPLPSESTPFTFSCKCFNLKVNGRIANKDERKISKSSKDRIKVYLPVGAEVVRLNGYVTYDQDDFKQPMNNDVEEDGDDTLGPSWRTCWLCDTKCYEATGKSRKDGAADEEWVTVKLGDGILFGDDMHNLSQELLTFSKLRLAFSKTHSNFGKPPNNHEPTPYPLPNQTSDPSRLIPPPHDPFFLPPPFIPNNAHLRDLCDHAGDHLKQAHKKLEDEVKRYISSKAQEMRDLEEKVRGEVEMLWIKYKDGPGKGEVEASERARSSSVSRSGSISRPISKDRASPLDQPNQSKNPLPKAVSAISPPSNAPGSSLLAQSLSANTFYAPQPINNASASVKDEINKTLDEVASTYDKRDDSRAVAMSYVLSSLSDHMGGSTSGTAGIVQSKRRSSSSKPEGEPVADKDSWIDEERVTLRGLSGKSNNMSALVEEDGESSTPRPKAVKELQGEKVKGKGKVTFEEPEVGSPQKVEELQDDTEDTVFDMEMDDHKDSKPVEEDSSPAEKLAQLPISRTRNIVEANLSRTFAADAPSHRAAWKKIEENGSMYATLRRGSSSSDDDVVVEDESQISKLAMSMPMAIHLPKSKIKQEKISELERKTSLSDKHGILVPPLLKAMRQRGISQEGNSLGLGLGIPATTTGVRGRSLGKDGNTIISRTASVSREREQLQSYQNDPGALYESLGDDDDDGEEEENGNDEEEGTLRDKKGFIPPHVLARKNDKEQLPNVGWRSMVQS